MNDRLDREAAEYFGVNPEILPFVPELLADLWELGSDPDMIVEWLRPLGLPAGSTRVLDLGCGKGAVGIRLAKELGFCIWGCDLVESFIGEARARAETLGVADHCQFEVADLSRVVDSARGFDVAIFASVGGTLGCTDECVGRMRSAVRSRGYMLIDEAYLASPPSGRVLPGYEHCRPCEKTRRQLVAHGDAILTERLLTVEQMRPQNERYLALIAARAEGLAVSYPEQAPALRRYVERQRRESAVFESSMGRGMWLLRRAVL